jgi:hypothetical protein
MSSKQEREGIEQVANQKSGSLLIVGILRPPSHEVPSSTMEEAPHRTLYMAIHLRLPFLPLRVLLVIAR